MHRHDQNTAQRNRTSTQYMMSLNLNGKKKRNNRKLWQNIVDKLYIIYFKTRKRNF